MRTLEVSRVTRPLAQYLPGLAGESLLLTSKGAPVAVLLPLKGSEDRESVALATNPRFLAMLERSEARLKREGALSVGDVRRRLAARRGRVRRAHAPRAGA